MRSTAFVACLVMLAPLGACNLIDKATAITFCNADEQVALDLSALDALTTSAELPQVPCGTQDDCSGAEQLLDCSALSPPCEVRCLGPVEGNDQLCGIELSTTVEQGVEISLANEVNRKIQNVKLLDVTLTRVEYSVVANTLTVDLPQTDVLVGPQSATTSSESGVALLAKLPAIEAGQTPKDQTVDTEPDGRSALTGFAKNYETPFRAFGRATVKAESGDALPAGAMTLSVKACFKATLAN